MKEGGAAGLLNEGGGAAGLLNEGGGAAGLLNEGGGEQQASCLVAKQAVEFPQVYTSLHNNTRSRRRRPTTVRMYVTLHLG